MPSVIGYAEESSPRSRWVELTSQTFAGSTRRAMEKEKLLQ